MKVFVTGGTGTTGTLLVENLLKSGHEVTVITRNIESVGNSWKTEVTLIQGSVMAEGDWQSSLAGQDAVIHLMGETVFGKRWSKKQKKKIYDSRVIATTNLVDTINAMEEPPSVLVSVSGSDYYPSSETRVFTEDDEADDSFLGGVTEDWESPITKLNKKTRGVIFRMGVAFGYSGASAERMFLTHKLFVGGWIGSGRQIYSWIHIRDFVGLLQWGMENEEVTGIFNGVAPDYKSMKELAIQGGNIMGRWTWTWAPGFMLRLVLGERASILLQGRALSSEKVIKAGYSFLFPDAQSALEDIFELEY